MVRRSGAHRLLHLLGQPRRRASRKRRFEDYVRQGPLAALDAIKQATGEEEVRRRRLLRRRHAAGGRRLPPWRRGATSASCRRRCSPRRSISPMPAISRSSSTRSRSRRSSERMAERGYLEGKSMATVFNLLRSNDLLWPYVINNYLKGKAPFPFDLLYWNSDATRHAGRQPFVLSAQLLSRQPAVEGRGGDRQHADRSRNRSRCRSTIWRRARTTSRRRNRCCSARNSSAAPVRFVLVGLRPYRRRGQSAGQDRSINTGPVRSRAMPTLTVGSRRRRSIPAPGGRTGLPGSSSQVSAEAPARVPGDGKLKPIEDAPGSYVKVRD